MFGPHLQRIRLNGEERLSAARLQRDVDMLAGLIGPRHVGRYDMLVAAERYIRRELTLAGRAVEDQPFECNGRLVRNIILERPGTRRPGEIIVIGAHYDTVPTTPGADDNASAVAGLLEIARRLAGRRFARTLRFVAFVNEEPPYSRLDDMGSLRYAEQCRRRHERIVGMLSLEMLGYYDDAPGSQSYRGLGRWTRLLPSRGNFIAICGDFNSAGLLWEIASGFVRSVRFPMLPFLTRYGTSGTDLSDNWSFWECGYPALMVTDTAFLRNPNYHEPGDRPATLHYPAMTRIVTGLSGAIARFAGEQPRPHAS